MKFKHNLKTQVTDIGLVVPDGYTYCDGCRCSHPNTAYHKKQLSAEYPWCIESLRKNRKRYNTLMAARAQENTNGKD